MRNGAVIENAWCGIRTGLREDTLTFATVTRCDFDLTTWPASVRSNYGLYLNGCTGYKVEENTFMRTTYPTGPLAIDNSTGVCVKTSGIANNSLYRNNSLTETRFCEGYSETFAENADDAEMANYAEFHAMKLALKNQNDNADNQNNDHSSNLPNSPITSPTTNWYALTPAQIAQLQTIAERNTGRSSVMAKGVLCFFFDICYEDEELLADEDGDTDAETRAKHTAIIPADDAALNVYPNPTDDLLYVELAGADIANITLYDLQGRIIYSPNLSNLPINMQNVPAGVYVLRVTGADGRDYHQKIVKK